MKTSSEQWKIVFDGREVYHVKSKRNCIQIIVVAIFFVLIPILVLVLTYIAEPCILLGRNGKQVIHNTFIKI